MTIQSIEQQRAKSALTAVQSFIKDKTSQSGEFLRYAKELPAMIHMTGLGQAMALYKSKKGTHEKLYLILSEWLQSDDKPYANGTDLLQEITTSDMNTYRMAQSEAQAYLVWLKNFAKAYCNKTSGTD